MTRNLKYFEALREALDLCLAKDPFVYLMGLGVPDPKGIFGTTLGLQEKYGAARVMDMPVSENGMTGVAVGSALAGMRPVMVHQRLDFALLAVEQIVNQAAKWHYMFAGQQRVPLVIRLIVGRGWGQGPQHSQSLHAWFAHIPGLKVVMPVTPHDAKGLMISSIEDDNPVIIIEHRWLHNTFGPVPEGIYRVPLGRARIAREGRDITLIGMSYAVLEALHAAEILAQHGVEAEVVDVRTVSPLDKSTLFESVRKTGRVLVADTASKTGGFAGEIVAAICEEIFGELKCPPARFALRDCPVPTSPALAMHYYPSVDDLVTQVLTLLNVTPKTFKRRELSMVTADVPDREFTGPF